MSEQETKDIAVEKAGKILINAFPAFYGSIKFNLQGKRKTVHANIIYEIGVEVTENKQFLEPTGNPEIHDYAAGVNPNK